MSYKLLEVSVCKKRGQLVILLYHHNNVGDAAANQSHCLSVQLQLAQNLAHAIKNYL